MSDKDELFDSITGGYEFRLQEVERQLGKSKSRETYNEQVIDQRNAMLTHAQRELDVAIAVIEAWELFINKQSSAVMPERLTREYLAAKRST